MSSQNKPGGDYIPHSKRRTVKNTSRLKHSQVKSDESITRSKSLVETSNMNRGCLFGGHKLSNTRSYEQINSKSLKGAGSTHNFRTHLKSLEKQISDKKIYNSDKSFYLSPEYVKLKIGKYEIYEEGNYWE